MDERLSFSPSDDSVSYPERKMRSLASRSPASSSTKPGHGLHAASVNGRPSSSYVAVLRAASSRASANRPLIASADATA
jgi:hypothetical protein